MWWINIQVHKRFILDIKMLSRVKPSSNKIAFYSGDQIRPLHWSWPWSYCMADSLEKVAPCWKMSCSDKLSNRCFKICKGGFQKYLEFSDSNERRRSDWTWTNRFNLNNNSINACLRFSSLDKHTGVRYENLSLGWYFFQPIVIFFNFQIQFFLC